MPKKILDATKTTVKARDPAKMVFGKHPKHSRQIPGLIPMTIVGTFIGTTSSLMGIGGGTLSLPFMVWHNVELRKAIGTSAAIGMPIALTGCLGYLVNGLGTPNLPQYSAGFIFLPALAGIVIFSMSTAPYGARLAQTLPIAFIKKCFAVLLCVVGLSMLRDAI